MASSAYTNKYKTPSPTKSAYSGNKSASYLDPTMSKLNRYEAMAGTDTRYAANKAYEAEMKKLNTIALATTKTMIRPKTAVYAKNAMKFANDYLQQSQQQAPVYPSTFADPYRAEPPAKPLFGDVADAFELEEARDSIEARIATLSSMKQDFQR